MTFDRKMTCKFYTPKLIKNRWFKSLRYTLHTFRQAIIILLKIKQTNWMKPILLFKKTNMFSKQCLLLQNLYKTKSKNREM